MSFKNVLAMWERRDMTDHDEGLLAYSRYRNVMTRFAGWYDIPIEPVTSAFVALSPNSDYHGNLRSLASVLDGYRQGIPAKRITVSTFNAARDRAYSYLQGVNFMATVKGLKTRAFRDNILRPHESPLVTVDGHMVAIWKGKDLTMKEAGAYLKSRRDYLRISADIVELAVRERTVPCKVQAILWMTRKRIANVKYNPQLSLFDDPTRTLVHPRDFPPYPLRAKP